VDILLSALEFPKFKEQMLKFNVGMVGQKEDEVDGEKAGVAA